MNPPPPSPHRVLLALSLALVLGPAAVHSSPVKLPKKPAAARTSPSPATPLTSEESRTVDQALHDRKCPCPCGLTLQECFGCTVAKDDLSWAVKGARSGLDPESIRRGLEAPVQLVVWIDVTHAASLELDAICHRIAEARPGVVRVLHRYLPANDKSLWRDASTVLELAREIGRFDEIHAAFHAHPVKNLDQLSKFCEEQKLPIDRVQEAFDTDRYSAQLEKDVSSAKDDYEVPEGTVPVIVINEELYHGDHTQAAIEAAIDRQLRRLSH